MIYMKPKMKTASVQRVSGSIPNTSFCVDYPIYIKLKDNIAAVVKLKSISDEFKVAGSSSV